jgi:membrane protease YdiL (CAAX protease family)
MSDEAIKASNKQKSPRRQHLLDILFLLLFSIGWIVFIVQVVMGKFHVPELVVEVFIPTGIMLFTWGLIRWRGDRWANFGLKRPENMKKAIGVFLGLLLFIWFTVTFTEWLGIKRDLSQFEFIRGNPFLLVYFVIYVLIFAGFYEEIMFRGFLMVRLAQIFGGCMRLHQVTNENRHKRTAQHIGPPCHGAWYLAIIMQGVFFGFVHAYQGLNGIIITGVAGMIMGATYLLAGRNLWPLILAHGVYDAIRMISFYFGYIG